MLWWELKKIWTKERVLLMAAVALLFTLTFLMPQIRAVTVTDDGEEIFSVKMGIVGDWLAEYGPSISPREFEKIKETYEQCLSAGQAVISARPYFAENNVYNYGDYLSYGNKALNGVEGYSYDNFKKMRKLISEGSEYSAMYLQEYEDLVQKYESNISLKTRDIKTNLSGKAEKAALSALEMLRRKGGGGSLLPGEFVHAENRYFVNLSILLIILAMLISAPVMVNDNVRGIRQGQYSSRTGRKIYRRQYAAMSLSLSLFTASMLVGYLLLWLGTGAGRFFRCAVFSFQAAGTPILGNLSYGGYTVLTAAMIFVLVNGVGGLVFYLSAVSRGYTEMLMKAIPAAVFGITLSLSLNDLFLHTNFLFRMTGIKGLEVFSIILIFIFGLLINLKGICE